MSCKNKKRKISDLLDGRLSDKQKSIIENHISLCPPCREYKNQLMLLSSKVREREKNAMPKDYALEFSISLKRRLLNEQQQKKQKNRFPGFEKWAYSAAGFIVVLFLVLYFVVFQPASIQTEGYYVLSFEDALEDLYGEINNDVELEELFNTMILASLDKALEDLDGETIPFIIENPLYGEDLSEEDLKILESKIKEDIKS
jgi:hypothetical protein